MHRRRFRRRCRHDPTGCGHPRRRGPPVRASSSRPSDCGVSIRPGMMVFTRIPRGASSAAALRARPITAGLARGVVAVCDPAVDAARDRGDGHHRPAGAEVRARRRGAVRITPCRSTCSMSSHARRSWCRAAAAGGRRRPATTWSTRPHGRAPPEHGVDVLGAADVDGDGERLDLRPPRRLRRRRGDRAGHRRTPGCRCRHPCSASWTPRVLRRSRSRRR